MISYFKVKEQSMEPWVREGDFVVAESMSYLFSIPKVGHVVVAKHPLERDRLLIKRIKRIHKDRYWLQGDNSVNSIDSRQFGWFKRPLLVGKVIHKTAPFDPAIML